MSVEQTPKFGPGEPDMDRWEFIKRLSLGISGAALASAGRLSPMMPLNALVGGGLIRWPSGMSFANYKAILGIATDLWVLLGSRYIISPAAAFFASNYRNWSAFAASGLATRRTRSRSPTLS